METNFYDLIKIWIGSWMMGYFIYERALNYICFNDAFKIKGEGIAPQGRRPGDLYVKVFISPPTNLSRSAKKHLENYRDQFESGDSPRKYLYE
jgi:DnaJ-class molecular chaperone